MSLPHACVWGLCEEKIIPHEVLGACRFHGLERFGDTSATQQAVAGGANAGSCSGEVPLYWGQASSLGHAVCHVASTMLEPGPPGEAAWKQDKGEIVGQLWKGPHNLQPWLSFLHHTGSPPEKAQMP